MVDIIDNNKKIEDEMKGCKDSNLYRSKCFLIPRNFVNISDRSKEFENMYKELMRSIAYSSFQKKLDYMDSINEDLCDWNDLDKMLENTICKINKIKQVIGETKGALVISKKMNEEIDSIICSQDKSDEF